MDNSKPGIYVFVTTQDGKQLGNYVLYDGEITREIFLKAAEDLSLNVSNSLLK